MTGLRFGRLVDCAKARVVADVPDGGRRAWKSAAVGMYGEGGGYGDRLKLWVLEGTPPRGWVVALIRSQCVQWADAFDQSGALLVRYTIDDDDDFDGVDGT